MTTRLFATLYCLLFFVPNTIAVAADPAPAKKSTTAPTTKPADASKDKAEDEKKEPEDRYFAVTGATVHTITGPTLRGATVLCKNGKITHIGTDATIPKDAETLDAKGFHLYPGLVSVSSAYSLVGNEPPENNTDLYSLPMTLALSGGITTTVTGNTAAKLTFGTLDGHVIKRNLFTTLSSRSSNPSGWRQLIKELERVRKHMRDMEIYEEQKKLDPKAKAPDTSWLKGNYDKARKLLRHELVAVASANTARDLADLAGLAGQYDIRIVVRGAGEGWIVAPAMARANMRAIITPRTRQDANERSNRPNGSSIENARILHDRGIMFAITPASAGISTGGLAGRDLWHLPMEAAFAVRGGLPDEAAVRAITIDAARILGIDHRVGSIEVGKDADFAIVDGDLLHYMTHVRWSVVNGRIAYDKTKDSLLNHIRPDGDLDAPPPVDHWPRRLGTDW